MLVVARFQVEADKIEAFQISARALASAARAGVGGPSFYAFGRPKGQPGTFVFIEEYSAKDTFKAHAQSDYMKSFLDLVRPMLLADPAIEIIMPDEA
jgi:quinol monooxygenase YgiN